MPEFLIYYSKSLNKELERKNLGNYIVYLHGDRDQLIEQINNDIYYKLRDKNKNCSIENENFIKKYKVKARKTDIPESIWNVTILEFTEKLFIKSLPIGLIAVRIFFIFNFL